MWILSAVKNHHTTVRRSSTKCTCEKQLFGDVHPPLLRQKCELYFSLSKNVVANIFSSWATPFFLSFPFRANNPFHETTGIARINCYQQIS
mmetsp:Transcript_4054/g.5879  ORF Transcript_4054/g.5879 Transcript_4054/m.5879 type:complete len:91 (-) Transcript_4054:539-811(-)